MSIIIQTPKTEWLYVKIFQGCSKGDGECFHEFTMCYHHSNDKITVYELPLRCTSYMCIVDMLKKLKVKDMSKHMLHLHS